MRNIHADLDTPTVSGKDALGSCDLGRFFYLGKSVVWKIVEVSDNVAFCQMVGTDDCVTLPQHVISPLMEMFDDAWSEYYFYA